MRSRPVRMLCAVAILLIAGGVSGSLVAQSTNPFGGISALSCEFPLEIVGSWSGANPAAEIKHVALSFQLKDVNPDEGSARFVDTTNDVRIVSRLSRSNLYFIDIRPDGTLATTTVFEKVTNEKKLRAVHSRTHYYRYVGPDFVSVPEVEQYLGSCEPVP